jgi:hypothetical protein
MKNLKAISLDDGVDAVVTAVGRACVGAIEAGSGGDDFGASLAAAQAAVELMKQELANARALQAALALQKAFEERPDVAAFGLWSRYRDFGVALARKNETGELEEFAENDRALDPRAVEFYADPNNHDPSDGEPDYETEDFIYGPFHQAMEAFMKQPGGALVEWEVDEEVWIERGDALSIAEGLGMLWMRSWLEKAGLSQVAASAPRVAKSQARL